MAMLGFASFSSCEMKKMYGPPPAPEYGVPYLELIVNGTVTDPAGNPIPGIRVEDSYTGISGTTDASGKVVGLALERTGEPEFDLYFKDPDGPDNGGSFARDTLFYKDMEIRQVEISTFELNFEKKLHPAQDGE